MAREEEEDQSGSRKVCLDLTDQSEKGVDAEKCEIAFIKIGNESLQFFLLGHVSRCLTPEELVFAYRVASQPWLQIPVEQQRGVAAKEMHLRYNDKNIEVERFSDSTIWFGLTLVCKIPTPRWIGMSLIKCGRLKMNQKIKNQYLVMGASMFITVLVRRTIKALRRSTYEQTRDLANVSIVRKSGGDPSINAADQFPHFIHGFAAIKTVR